MIVHAYDRQGGDYIVIRGVEKINRIRTDLQYGSKEPGWILTTEEGLEILYEKFCRIVAVTEEQP